MSIYKVRFRRRVVMETVEYVEAPTAKEARKKIIAQLESDEVELDWSTHADDEATSDYIVSVKKERLK